MKMQHKEALKILGLKNGVSFEEIKNAYRKASMTYHPDRNPAGLEMMKLVNAAWNALSDYVADSVIDNDDDINLGEELNAALNAVIGLGLTIEICGSWIWVSGDTKPHREVLKTAGYRWAPKKLMWSFCGGERTSSRGKFSMDDIRSKHGSQTVNNKQFYKLSA
jgi:hypothetical protein